MVNRVNYVHTIEYYSSNAIFLDLCSTYISVFTLLNFIKVNTDHLCVFLYMYT